MHWMVIVALLGLAVSGSYLAWFCGWPAIQAYFFVDGVLMAVLLVILMTIAFLLDSAGRKQLWQTIWATIVEDWRDFKRLMGWRRL